jgi:hypothetical protein
MRKVLSTIDVAHAWANQTQSEARSNSLSFRGPSLSSYSLEIARIVKNKRGESITLFVEIGVSSSTTSTHQGMAHSACSHHERITVPSIIEREWPKANEIDHAKMFAAWAYKAKNIAAHLERATKPIKYLDELATLSRRIERYAEFFGVKVPDSLLKTLAIRTGEEWKAVDKRDRAKAEREKANRAKKDAALRLRAVAEWRAFKRDYVSGRDGRDFLRYNADKKRIETSQGVQIPVTVGRRMFAWLIPLAANGGCVPCDYKILDFQVSAVHSDRVEVGCHTVYLDEINAMAQSLGWA